MSHAEPSAGATAPRLPRATVEFGLLLLGAEVCRHLEFPVRAVGIGFAVAAVAVGAWILARRRSAVRGTAATVTLALGMVAAATLLLWHLALVAVSPVYTAYERCTDIALTRVAQDSCQDDLMSRIDALRE